MLGESFVNVLRAGIKKLTKCRRRVKWVGIVTTASHEESMLALKFWLQDLRNWSWAPHPAAVVAHTAEEDPGTLGLLAVGPGCDHRL